MRETNSFYMGIYHSVNFLLFLFSFGLAFITARIFFQRRLVDLPDIVQVILYWLCGIVLLIGSMVFSSHRTTKCYFVDNENIVSGISSLVAFGLILTCAIFRTYMKFEKIGLDGNFIGFLINKIDLIKIFLSLILLIFYFFVNKSILNYFTIRNIKRDLKTKKTI